MKPIASQFGRPFRAFTLVELMISISLVIILVLGVSQVFKYSADAVGAGQTLSQDMGNIRGAVAIMNIDVRNLAKDSPLWIDCETSMGADKWGFQTQFDKMSDMDGDPVTANVGLKTPAPAEVGYRNHREDMIGFFAQGNYRRQTGNDGSFVSNMTSNEVWIWYGHLIIVDQNGNPAPLGRPGTPNEYGADLTLGRQVILLRDADGANQILDNNKVPQSYLTDITAGSGTSGAPLAGNFKLEDGRLDLVRGSINAMNQNYTTPASISALRTRFTCHPFVVKPMSARDMAQSSNYFLGHVSQFIVEFAGDYVAQNPDATLHAAAYQAATTNTSPVPTAAVPIVTDGQPDFCFDMTADPSWDHTAADHLPSPKWLKKIRWYGLPRDLENKGRVGAPIGSPSANPTRGIDVLTVRDMLCFGNWNNITPSNPTISAPFEITLPSPAPSTNYQSILPGTPYSYICQFCKASPSQMPSMIRISLKIDDPAGRLRDGPWVESVFNLQE